MLKLGMVIMVFVLNGCATGYADEPKFTDEDNENIKEYNTAAKDVNEEITKLEQNGKPSEKVLMDGLAKVKDLEPKIRAACLRVGHGCAGFDHIKSNIISRLSDIKHKEEEAVRSNSEDGIYNDACIAASQYTKSQAVIDREKEIGKHTGTVNMVTLHQAGEYLMQYRAELLRLSEKYKKKTGKQINLKDCGKS